MSELRADVGNGGDFPDEVLEELTHGFIGLLAVPKVLPDIGIKVPPTDIPKEKIQREHHLVQRPPFHVESREGTSPSEAGSWHVFVVFR